MMDIEQYLLARIAEEAGEVAHRALKAQLFGLNEIQSGQGLTNYQRLGVEACDLAACIEALEISRSGEWPNAEQRKMNGKKWRKMLTFAKIGVDAGLVGDGVLAYLDMLANGGEYQ